MVLTIQRRLLNEELKKVFRDLKPGLVLDVGGANSPYKKIIPFRKYMVLEKHDTFKPDICCDAHDIKAKSNFFDTVVSTEMLEHVEDPKKVVSEFHRILKKNGFCIVSTPFLYHIHEDDYMKDYWRFTESGLKLLFGNFSEVNVYGYGSTSTTIFNLFFCRFPFLNRLSPIFYRLKIGTLKSGYIVKAKK
jgi:SAM-dependent methyltransferase